MPICVSYLTNTIPIMGGGGAALFLQMPMENTIFMQIFIFLPMRMLPKMEKEKSFTIIYADILIFANFCQCQCCLKWKKLGAIRQHWRK